MIFPSRPRIRCQPWQSGGAGAGLKERTEVLGIGVREKVPLRRPMLLLRACNRTEGRRGRSGTSLRAKTAERGAERCHLFYFHEAAFSAPSELFFDNHGGFPARERRRCALPRGLRIGHCATINRTMMDK